MKNREIAYFVGGLLSITLRALLIAMQIAAFAILLAPHYPHVPILDQFTPEMIAQFRADIGPLNNDVLLIGLVYVALAQILVNLFVESTTSGPETYEEEEEEEDLSILPATNQ